MTTTDKNRYTAEYMRRYRARKAAERVELLAQAERREPETQVMLTQILEAVTALSEQVARMEAALTRNANELTETNVKPNVSKLTRTNVNKGKTKAKERVRVNVKGSNPTAEDLAREAQALHAQGLSYERIARRWTEAGIPTLKGGRWHKGTIAKIIQRYVGD